MLCKLIFINYFIALAQALSRNISSITIIMKKQRLNIL